MHNLPIYFLILVFAVLMFALSRVQLYTPVINTESDVPVPVESECFTGRMVMPSLDDIYVLDNSAGRDIVQFEKFLKGRAAGLHFASAAYFKANRKNAHKDSNAFMGIKLTLDSTGFLFPKFFSPMWKTKILKVWCFRKSRPIGVTPAAYKASSWRGFRSCGKRIIDS